MQEYVDFLGKQDPYDRLDADDLRRLAGLVEVEYFATAATIIDADGPELDHLYVIRTGIAHVRDRGRLVDELGPGDTFGQIFVMSGLPPAVSVVAASDVLVYLLPDPRGVVKHPERLAFANHNRMVSRRLLRSGAGDNALRKVSDFMRPATWCEATSSIRDAARLMSRDHQSCVVFGSAGGLGIMTDSDCRSQVATGVVPIDAPVIAAGTVPALSVAPTVTAATAFLQMVHHGVHHLLVCAASGEVVGVLRAVDLASAETRDPLLTRAAIDDATTLKGLREAAQLIAPTAAELRATGIPALRIGALLGAMIEAVVERCVSFDPAFVDPGDGSPASDTSWLVLGSLARREPLPWSDVDTALVWATPAAAVPPDPGRRHEAAERVIAAFESCGLRRCVDGANASNPLFSRSRAAWAAAAAEWVAHPPDAAGALLLPGIIFDSRPITGVALGRELAQAIAGQATTPQFLQSMLDEALANRPPTGFVRDVVVEASGRHRGALNLKRRGLQPVVAIGRWVAITLGQQASSTLERLRSGAEAGLLTKDEAQTLEGGFHDMYELLFANELDAILAAAPVTTYLNPKDLDSLARRHLREAFRAIARVQSRLEAEWVSRLG